MNAHVMNPRTRLSAEQRAKLRKAISGHDGWNDYRRTHGFTMDAMSTEQLFSAADALGVDVAMVTAIDAHTGPKPRPYGKEQVQDLYARCQNVSMNAKDAALCSDIFSTIRNKQDGEATEGQWDCILTRVVRAEIDAQNPPPANAPQAPTPAPAPRQESAPMLDKPTPAADPAHQLASLIGQLAGQSLNPAQVARIVDERITEALKGMPAVQIECKGFDGQIRNVDGHQHPAFKRLLTAASSRMANGYAPNIWLAGPAGSGKTHAGHMLADAMGLAFHLNGAISMPHELLGFIDAAGHYHRTPFREAYEHGGIYMFDEVDGSDNSAILALNAALANGHATFPDMKVKRHPACIIVASANTWGLGATAEYVGRAKIDAAFLSRFPVRIGWEYDPALEVAISGHEAFARRVIAARERARAAGLKVLIDPRASQAGAALIAAGMKPDDAAELTYLANLSKDQRKIVEG